MSVLVTDAADWPLVGRGEELGRMARSLTRPSCAALLLVGAAGVGKTRLAGACLETAARAGFVTLEAKATRSAAVIPFGALAPLLPGFDEPGPTVGGLRRAADAIASLGRGRPLLVLADDAHNLDEPSAALLHQLAASRRAFVLGTARAGAELPDALAKLWREDTGERIDLAALGRAAVEELLGVVLDGPLDGVSVQRLWELSQGNALYLRELLHAALADGNLRRDDGLWRLGGHPGSARLVEIVAERLSGLAPRARRCLEVVAVGEPVGMSQLAQLVEPDVVHDLERRGLVDQRVDGRRHDVRLAHPLHGDVLRRQLPVWRLTEVSAFLADQVEQAGARRREDGLRVASWRLASGGPVHPALFVRAARRACFSQDLPLGERLAGAALQAGGGVDALQVLGQAMDGLGRHAEAEQILAAADLTAADDEQRALLALTRSHNLFWGLDRLDQAIAVSEDAEQRITDAGWRRRVAANRSSVMMLAGRPLEAMAAVGPILDGTDAWARNEAAIVAVPALVVTGRTAAAADLADRAAAEAVGLGADVVDPGIHLVARSLALMEGGRLQEAADLAASGYAAAVEAKATNGQAWFALMLGRVNLHIGDAPAAVRYFGQAAAIWRDSGENGPVRWCLAGTALARASQGDRRATAEAGQALSAVPRGPFHVMEPDITRARAWVLLLAGQAAACAEQLWAAADQAAGTGQVVLAAAALHDLARLGHAKSAAQRLGGVAGACDGDLAPARAAHAAALAAGRPAALEEAAMVLGSIGAFLYAGEAATAAAAAWRRAGDNRRATFAERRASAHLAHCPGARTPALVAYSGQAALSEREKEIVLLARELTSKQIAAQMRLSVRTVDNHLQRAFVKLGVRRRSDLDNALGIGRRVVGERAP